MNYSIGNIARIIGSINRTLNLVNKAIPLYQQMRPMISKLPSIINAFQNNNSVVSEPVNKEINDEKVIETKKISTNSTLTFFQ